MWIYSEHANGFVNLEWVRKIYVHPDERRVVALHGSGDGNYDVLFQGTREEVMGFMKGLHDFLPSPWQRKGESP